MTPWSPTNSRTSRTCGGPGWSWPHCTEQPATTTCRLDSRSLVLSLDNPDDSWLRMRRTHRSRAVLWGRSARAPSSPPDARRGAPDWALSDATEERRPTFLAWYAHGEWDTNTSCPDEGALHLLRPLLTVDPRVVELGRHGRLTDETLEAYANGDHLQEATELVKLAGADAPPTSLGLGALTPPRPGPRPDARRRSRSTGC